MKLKTEFGFLLFLFSPFFSQGQFEHFDHKREVIGVTDQWHKVVLPNDIFKAISSDLSDLRIYGISAEQDTVEVPYMLKVATDERSTKTVEFKMINSAEKDGLFYSTFEVPTADPLDQIDLQFSQQNFNWKIALEGSQDQREWFMLLEDYRILSIKNGATDYQFTKLLFPRSRYRFLRLRIQSSERPDLRKATLSMNEFSEGKKRLYSVKKIKTEFIRQTKNTEIVLDLKEPVPVSSLKITVLDTIDYYRPITIKYLKDSTKTEKGWRYSYSTLTSGILSSFESNEFEFKSTILQTIKIIVQDENNQPLNIGDLEVKGFDHEMIVRFTGPASYFLVYGNVKASAPRYDLAHFEDNIPTSLVELELGQEMEIKKTDQARNEPLFKNKKWLWATMLLIIGLLGWSSIKMIRKK